MAVCTAGSDRTTKTARAGSRTYPEVSTRTIMRPNAWPICQAHDAGEHRVRAGPIREAREGARMRRDEPTLRDRGERCRCRTSLQTRTSPPVGAVRRCATSFSCHTIMQLLTGMAVWPHTGPARTSAGRSSSSRAPNGSLPRQRRTPRSGSRCRASGTC